MATSNTLLSVLAFAGDKAAQLAAVQADIHTAAVRTVLHNDTALFKTTLQALADGGAVTKAGETSKNTKGDIYARLKAAELSAREARAVAFPEGRKGTASAEDKAKAEGHAATIAGDFMAAIIADKAARTEAAKAAREASKAAKAAELAKAAPEGEETEEAATVEGTEEAAIVAEVPEYVGFYDDGLTVDGFPLSWDEVRAFFAERAALAAMAKAA